MPIVKESVMSLSLHPTYTLDASLQLFFFRFLFLSFSPNDPKTKRMCSEHHPMPASERYSSTSFTEDKSFQEHNPSSMLCFQSSCWNSEQYKTKS